MEGSEIITTIVDSVTGIVGGSAGAISEGVIALLFNTGADGQITGLSQTAIVIFTLFGLGMGVGLMYVIFNLVTRR